MSQYNRPASITLPTNPQLLRQFESMVEEMRHGLARGRTPQGAAERDVLLEIVNHGELHFSSLERMAWSHSSIGFLERAYDNLAETLQLYEKIERIVAAQPA